MNLWVRTLGQLVVLTVALFFFSCEDDSSILGFKNPVKKFKVNFVDIPLASDVFLLDSLRSSNFYGVQGESIRLLAGKYTDDQFGQVNATAISQFFTTNTSKTLLKPSAEFDSVSMDLAFDFYTYGTQSVSSQTISVHELENELKFDSASYYFSKSNAPYNPSALGSKTFSISAADFKKYLEDKKDTTLTVHMPLELSFGQRIFDSALKYQSSTTPADSAFARLRDFVKEFKGIAVVADAGDKIIGYNPSSTATRITLHYHDSETDSLELNLSLSGVINYNQIGADRSSTELAGLTQFSQPITPASNNRYIQSGTGVLTRLDFQKFYDFVDADTNLTVVVNSAELRLGASLSTVLPPITNLSLFGIRSEGYLKKVANKDINPTQYFADSASVALYAGKLGISGGMFSPLDADGNVFNIQEADDDTGNFNGFLTLFAQEFFKRKVQNRFRFFALYPTGPQIGKSVNRLVFDAENIKLRIYYTRPTESTQ